MRQEPEEVVIRQSATWSQGEEGMSALVGRILSCLHRSSLYLWMGQSHFGKGQRARSFVSQTDGILI